MFLQLPQELTVEIFVRLSVKDLVRFKCVCKTWRDLIDSSSFTDKYQNLSRKKFVSFYERGFYLLDVEDTESESEPHKLDFPLKSMSDESICALHCHGMLCVTLKNHSLAVWNPSSKKFKIIPNRNIYRDSNILGFGYDPLSDDYKIVTFVDRLDSSTAYIFEFKSNSWKESLQIPSPTWHYRDRKGTVLDQNLYWIAYRSDQDRFILCFNFTTQKYQKLPFPTCTENPRSSWLGVVGRKLCVIEHDLTNKKIEIWAMETTNTNIKSWNTFINVSTSDIISRFEGSDYHIDFVSFTKNDDLLIAFTAYDTGYNDLSTGLEGLNKKVFLYKTKDETFEEVRSCKPLTGFQFLDEYIECPVSLNLH